MGYVTVAFLGEKYQVSETINEFLSYDQLLTPIRIKLLNTMTANIKNDAKLSFGGYLVDYVRGKSDACCKIVDDSVELLVNKLLELEIYDVTKSDLLKHTTTKEELENLAETVLRKMLGEGEKALDMKRAEEEKAYSYATSNITDSGISFFTNSFSSLMIHSIVERNMILAQAKKADKEYEEAVRAISTRAKNAIDSMCSEVMIMEYYSVAINIMLEFDNKIMAAFLLELTTHEKFDLESMEKYNMLRAEEMLENINQVPDKVGFLKQVFLTCPFSLEVYEACLEHDLIDKDTFETARYFGLADELAEKIEAVVKDNLENTEKITPLISILALHRGTNEIDILKKIYEGTLKKIEDTYKTFHIALSDKRELDRFIRDNISREMKEIIRKSKGDTIKSIDKELLSVVSEKQYDEFVGMGILSPENIRMSGSSATILNDINSEIRNALADCIMEYIEEAKRRLDAYNRAMDIYEKELKQKNGELSDLQYEKKKLGLFAFSKKKEMAASIDAKVNEISEFKRIHEPNDLWAQFETMYR